VSRTSSPSPSARRSGFPSRPQGHQRLAVLNHLAHRAALQQPRDRLQRVTALPWSLLVSRRLRSFTYSGSFAVTRSTRPTNASGNSPPLTERWPARPSGRSPAS
jgi:hypothetical protein